MSTRGSSKIFIMNSTKLETVNNRKRITKQVKTSSTKWKACFENCCGVVRVYFHILMTLVIFHQGIWARPQRFTFNLRLHSLWSRCSVNSYQSLTVEEICSERLKSPGEFEICELGEPFKALKHTEKAEIKISKKNNFSSASRK